jgi:hypothetical protein
VIDYEHIARLIRAKCRCSLTEAWSGLATAFLTLDTTRSEGEQVAYLLKYGRFAVLDEWRSNYTDAEGGVLRMVPSDYSMFSSVPTLDHDFSELFPDYCRGYAEYLARGRTYSLNSARHYLRTRAGINKRTSTRRLYEDTRLHAKRLQELVGILSLQTA